MRQRGPVALRFVVCSPEAGALAVSLQQGPRIGATLFSAARRTCRMAGTSCYHQSRNTVSPTSLRQLVGARRGYSRNMRRAHSEQIWRASRSAPGTGKQRSWLSLSGMPDQAMTVGVMEERCGLRARPFSLATDSMRASACGTDRTIQE